MNHLLERQRVPDINDEYFDCKSISQYDVLSNPRFFRVHARYDPALRKVVYVLRDPRDVMVSYWHFKRFIDRDFTATLREFVMNGDHWPCPWDQHVAGWLLEHKHPDLLLVRYKDLHRDAAGVLKMVLDFSGVSYGPADIQRAVEASQFNKMRKSEEKFGIGEPVTNPNERFVRRGKISGWRDELDGDSLCALEERFSTTMLKVGFEPVTTSSLHSRHE
jgi:hypothetical protein